MPDPLEPYPEPEYGSGVNPNGDGKHWTTEFVVAVAVACLAIGLLLGIFIMCLYKRFPCQGDHRQQVVGQIPSCEYRCYPVHCGQGDARHPGDSQPVVMISDSFDCDRLHPMSNPPSYLSNAVSNDRRRISASPTTPNMSHHRLSLSTQEILSGQRTPGSLAPSQPDLDQSQVNRSRSQSYPLNAANGRRIHNNLPATPNLSHSQHAVCGSDNSSGQRTPGSLAPSHSDIDQNRVPVARNATSDFAQTVLSPIASASDGTSPSMSRHRLGNSRNLLWDGNDGQRARRNDREELIPMNELTIDVNEPQAVLQNAPVLDPTSILERLHDSLSRPPQRSREEIEMPVMTGGARSDHSNISLSCPSPGNVILEGASHSESSRVKRNNLQKDEVDKFIPCKQLPFGSLVLPNTDRVDFNLEECHEIQDLKLFSRCPEDIQIIFKPIEASRMITVRKKKIVYMCKRLDSKGGILKLDNMGISLIVPAEAIPQGQTSLVTLVLNWDLSDNPHMDRREALVSPVVYCGPHASNFERPCTLVFKHCAYDNRYAQIMTSETDLFEDKSWDDFGTNDNSHEEDSRQRKSLDSMARSNVSITVDECQVEVSHFSLYTCILRSKHLHMKKWLQVAVFTHEMKQSLHHQSIRVYFLNKTPCALQWAIQNEAPYGFRLACPENVFLFEERGEDLLVRLSYLSNGWQMVSQDGESPAGVQFEQIWHGACPHVCLCFKRSATPYNSQTSNSAVLAEPNAGAVGDQEVDLDKTPRASPVKEATPVSRETTQTYDKEQDGARSSEIIVCLKLSQTRSENVSTDIHILMYDLESIGVRVPVEGDTHLKTID